MPRITPLIVFVLAVSSIANADAAPFKEQLTKDQVAAATMAARDNVPPIDKTAMKKCRVKAWVRDDAEELAAAATCYQAAGALGLAITMWERVMQRFPNAAVAKDALRQLGPAYEVAGMFDKAATSHAAFMKKYGAEAGAVDRTIRAICIWRQLGIEKEADRGFLLLQATVRKQKFDSEALCDSVRPIAPPT